MPFEVSEASQIIAGLAALITLLAGGILTVWKVVMRHYVTQNQLRNELESLSTDFRKDAKMMADRFQESLRQELGSHIAEEEQVFKGIRDAQQRSADSIAELSRHILQQVPTREEMKATQKHSEDLSRAVHRLADAVGATDERDNLSEGRREKGQMI